MGYQYFLLSFPKSSLTQYFNTAYPILAIDGQPPAGREKVHLGIRNVVSCYDYTVSRCIKIPLNSILLSQLSINLCELFQAGHIGGGKQNNNDCFDNCVE